MKMEQHLKIEQLIEDYKTKIISINQRLFNLKEFGETYATKDRLTTKLSCYKIFISELERL